MTLDTIPQLTHDFDRLKATLYDLVLTTQAQRVLEIGTDVGDSTRLFATALRETGGHLWTVDAAPPKWPQGWLEPYPNVTVLTSPSQRLPWATPLDVLFVDGDHRGSTCLGDLRRYGPWVRVGGRIAVHDVCHSEFGRGIRRAVAAWAGSHRLPTYTIRQQHGLAIIEVTHALR